MQYFVIWPDGQKFGPADVNQLNTWAQEQRINPDTELESVVDGSKIKAKDLPGITFPAAATPTPETTAAPADPQQSVQQPVSQPADPQPQATQTSEPAQYFVIGTGGQKYGPADAATLTQWASENRLTPTTELEDSVTGARAPASQVPGIIFPVSAAGAGASAPTTTGTYTSGPQSGASSPYGATGAQSNYPRDYMTGDPDAGKTEAIVSFVLSGLGLFCCPCIFNVIAIILAVMSMKKGHSLGKPALIVAIVVLVIALLINIIFVFANPAYMELFQGL